MFQELDDESDFIQSLVDDLQRTRISHLSDNHSSEQERIMEKLKNLESEFTALMKEKDSLTKHVDSVNDGYVHQAISVASQVEVASSLNEVPEHLKNLEQNQEIGVNSEAGENGDSDPGDSESGVSSMESFDGFLRRSALGFHEDGVDLDRVQEEHLNSSIVDEPATAVTREGGMSISPDEYNRLRRNQIPGLNEPSFTADPSSPSRNENVDTALEKNVPIVMVTDEHGVRSEVQYAEGPFDYGIEGLSGVEGHDSEDAAGELMFDDSDLYFDGPVKNTMVAGVKQRSVSCDSKENNAKLDRQSDSFSEDSDTDDNIEHFQDSDATLCESERSLEQPGDSIANVFPVTDEKESNSSDERVSFNDTPRESSETAQEPGFVIDDASPTFSDRIESGSAGSVTLLTDKDGLAEDEKLERSSKHSDGDKNKSEVNAEHEGAKLQRSFKVPTEKEKLVHWDGRPNLTVEDVKVQDAHFELDEITGPTTSLECDSGIKKFDDFHEGKLEMTSQSEEKVHFEETPHSQIAAIVSHRRKTDQFRLPASRNTLDQLDYEPFVPGTLDLSDLHSRLRELDEDEVLLHRDMSVDEFMVEVERLLEKLSVIEDMLREGTVAEENVKDELAKHVVSCLTQAVCLLPTVFKCVSACPLYALHTQLRDLF